MIWTSFYWRTPSYLNTWAVLCKPCVFSLCIVFLSFILFIYFYKSTWYRKGDPLFLSLLQPIFNKTIKVSSQDVKLRASFPSECMKAIQCARIRYLSLKGKLTTTCTIFISCLAFAQHSFHVYCVFMTFIPCTLLSDCKMLVPRKMETVVFSMNYARIFPIASPKST